MWKLLDILDFLVNWICPIAMIISIIVGFIEGIYIVTILMTVSFVSYVVKKIREYKKGGKIK